MTFKSWIELPISYRRLNICMCAFTTQGPYFSPMLFHLTATNRQSEVLRETSNESMRMPHADAIVRGLVS